MSATALNRDEGIGLALALAAHAGLVAWLVYNPPTPAPVLPPERITVTISDTVGLTSAAPNPEPDAAPDQGPELGEPAPVPSPVVTPQPLPSPKPLPAPVPKPQPAPKPAPLSPKPQPRPTPPPKPAPAPTQKARPAPAPTTSAKPAAKPGASRIGNDFLKGVQGATGNTPSSNPPAATIGPAVQSALAGQISRQLKPKWVAPQGADAELLVTILAWDLNPDGTLAGNPRVVRQEGINDTNRAQAARHAEQAMRAVKLAAPFTLPPQYYSAWKRVSAFRFDRRLSQ